MTKSLQGCFKLNSPLSEYCILEDSYTNTVFFKYKAMKLASRKTETLYWSPNRYLKSQNSHKQLVWQWQQCKKMLPLNRTVPTRMQGSHWIAFCYLWYYLYFLQINIYQQDKQRCIVNKERVGKRTDTWSAKSGLLWSRISQYLQVI